MIFKFFKIWLCNFKDLFQCTWASVFKKMYVVIVFLQSELCFHRNKVFLITNFVFKNIYISEKILVQEKNQRMFFAKSMELERMSGSRYPA